MSIFAFVDSFLEWLYSILEDFGICLFTQSDVKDGFRYLYDIGINLGKLVFAAKFIIDVLS